MNSTEQPPSLNLLKWLSVGFFVLTFVITVVFFSWWGMRERFVFGEETFDPVRWMAPASAKKPPCDRGDMIRDIQKRVLMRGMTKAQVTVILGRPDWEEANQFEYELGVCQWVVHGFRLFFDNEDRLTHTGIIQH